MNGERCDAVVWMKRGSGGKVIFDWNHSLHFQNVTGAFFANCNILVFRELQHFKLSDAICMVPCLSRRGATTTVPSLLSNDVPLLRCIQWHSKVVWHCSKPTWSYPRIIGYLIYNSHIYMKLSPEFTLFGIWVKSFGICSSRSRLAIFQNDKEIQKQFGNGQGFGVCHLVLQTWYCNLNGSRWLPYTVHCSGQHARISGV